MFYVTLLVDESAEVVKGQAGPQLGGENPDLPFLS